VLLLDTTIHLKKTSKDLYLSIIMS